MSREVMQMALEALDSDNPDIQFNTATQKGSFMNKNPLSETYVPKNYPVELLQLVHERMGNIKINAQVVESWRAVVQYRDRELIDKKNEEQVARAIAREVIRKVTVFQDQSNSEGRLYHATLFAMDGGEFLDVLYLAYAEGQSDGMKRNSAIAKATGGEV